MFNKEIAQIYVEYAKKYLGKGPRYIRVNICDNLMLLDIRGTLTVLEQTILECQEDKKNLIKAIRQELFDLKVEQFTQALQKITGIRELKIKNYILDFDFDNDHEVIVFFMNKSISQVEEEF